MWMPTGLSEWVVHPGLGNEESQAIDPGGWRVRRTDYEFLTSPETRGLIQQEGIIVIDYRAIQQAWSRTRARGLTAGTSGASSADAFQDRGRPALLPSVPGSRMSG